MPNALDYLKEIFCNKPILQFSDPNNDYVLYTNASNNAYSGVLCQGMKITKLERWTMLLQEYDITFTHKDNILADAISQLGTINVYEDPIENKPQDSLAAQITAHSS